MQCDFCNVTVRPYKIHEHFCVLHPNEAYTRYLEDLVTALRESYDRFSIILGNMPNFKYTVKNNLLMIELVFQSEAHNAQSEQEEQTMRPAGGPHIAQSEKDEKTMSPVSAAHSTQTQQRDQTMFSIGEGRSTRTKQREHTMRVTHSAQSEQNERTMRPVGSVAFDDQQSIPLISKHIGDYDRVKFIGSVSGFHPPVFFFKF